MKIMLVELGTCSVNYQSMYLAGIIASNFQITNDIKEADIIVMMGGCACIDDTLKQTLSQIRLCIKT